MSSTTFIFSSSLFFNRSSARQLSTLALSAPRGRRRRPPFFSFGGIRPKHSQLLWGCLIRGRGVTVVDVLHQSFLFNLRRSDQDIPFRGLSHATVVTNSRVVLAPMCRFFPSTLLCSNGNVIATPRPKEVQFGGVAEKFERGNGAIFVRLLTLCAGP